MDNATNNDTLMDGIESRADAAGISWFNAKEARIRCLPHTTHLAALKLLEGSELFRRRIRNSTMQMGL
ncbi:hypothetical protein B0H10DRAFT_2070979, partial [Mycena sp. CBHHK59/15]